MRGTVTCPRLGKEWAFLERRRLSPSAMPGPDGIASTTRPSALHVAGRGVTMGSQFPHSNGFAMCLRARPSGWPFPPSLCEVGLYEHSACWRCSLGPPPVCDRPSGLVTPRECLRLSACVLIRPRGCFPLLRPLSLRRLRGAGRLRPPRAKSPPRGRFWSFLGRCWAGGPRRFRGHARAGAWSPRASSALGPALLGHGWRGPALRTLPIHALRSAVWIWRSRTSPQPLAVAFA